MTVVNDAAEREVKLAQTFLESSKSKESYQIVLQVVKIRRKKSMQSNQRKKISQRIL